MLYTKYQLNPIFKARGRREDEEKKCSTSVSSCTLLSKELKFHIFSCQREIKEHKMILWQSESEKEQEEKRDTESHKISHLSMRSIK